jgi:hypothetical protein
LASFPTGRSLSMGGTLEAACHERIKDSEGKGLTFRAHHTVEGAL